MYCVFVFYLIFLTRQSTCEFNVSTDFSDFNALSFCCLEEEEEENVSQKFISFYFKTCTYMYSKVMTCFSGFLCIFIYLFERLSASLSMSAFLLIV